MIDKDRSGIIQKGGNDEQNQETCVPPTVKNVTGYKKDDILPLVVVLIEPVNAANNRKKNGKGEGIEQHFSVNTSWRMDRGFQVHPQQIVQPLISFWVKVEHVLFVPRPNISPSSQHAVGIDDVDAVIAK